MEDPAGLCRHVPTMMRTAWTTRIRFLWRISSGLPTQALTRFLVRRACWGRNTGQVGRRRAPPVGGFFEAGQKSVASKDQVVLTSKWKCAKPCMDQRQQVWNAIEEQEKFEKQEKKRRQKEINCPN
ncbi:uncharacterized protein LOC119295257 [Triticum dicoccoides]|uniref:uncharacterized protein LOC119295257 n=1 Tax=Triticum dicoccoides TaxID=85692 RepID=UPI0018909454|nr:uncharacterized protein LOC119295257 [Triticum dicoccoides]